MINRVILMGRLCADPELKHTNSGTAVTSFRLAVDRAYVAQGKERQADFIDVTAWRSSAEFVCRNFSKGSLIAVDGQLQSRQYQTKDGQNRTAVEVVAESISFTGERRDQNTVQNNAQNQVQHNDPRVYPQNSQGAAYDPRYSQGTFEPPITPDADLPWN